MAVVAGKQGFVEGVTSCAEREDEKQKHEARRAPPIEDGWPDKSTVATETKT